MSSMQFHVSLTSNTFAMSLYHIFTLKSVPDTRKPVHNFQNNVVLISVLTKIPNVIANTKYFRFVGELLNKFPSLI
jgi:hypothetical protein